MIYFIDKILALSFYILFFILPLILFPLTSEIFEFNKIVIIYIFTTIILTSWITKIIISKKFIFRRTIFDVPILIFLASQILTTFTSIDVYTSLFGYYSRFNGGLLSSISYTLLYFAYTSNMTVKKTKKILILIISSFILICLYAVLERFGIDKNLWVQDVQNRVFSTLGQPNWLAAMLIAIIPLTWALAFGSKNGNTRWMVISSLFFITLLFTKSRSGLIGFIFTNITFWLVAFRLSKIDFISSKLVFKQFLFFNIIYLFITIIIGSPWTPNLSQIIQKETAPTSISESESNIQPALETGGTGSGEIRKIVWRGAFEIFKANPLLGTGVETFAYSYFLYRPKEHNLISEWDFLYNKAHNEYLNFLATTGIAGFSAYTILIIIIGISFIKEIRLIRISDYKYPENQPRKYPNILNVTALFSGFIGILVSNFFGFSVTAVSLLFFLYPAMFIVLGKNYKDSVSLNQKYNTGITQKVIVFMLCTVAAITLYAITRYWYADILYAQGKGFNKSKEYPQARESLFKAVKLIPFQAVYWDELSQSASGLAVEFYQTGSLDEAKIFSETAITESNHALQMSPFNMNIRKSNASLFIKLSNLDPKLLNTAENLIKLSINYSPTDAKLFYNLGLIQTRLGKENEAISTLEKAVELKSNYRDARFALAILYNKNTRKEKAKDHLMYILENINPNDALVKQQLSEIK